MSTLEVKENTELEQPKPVEISGSKDGPVQGGKS